MTEYHFNAGLARRYGVNGAIFLHAMAFWIRKNKSSGRNFHNGRTWTYNTLEAHRVVRPGRQRAGGVRPDRPKR